MVSDADNCNGFSSGERNGDETTVEKKSRGKRVKEEKKRKNKKKGGKKEREREREWGDEKEKQKSGKVCAIKRCRRIGTEGSRASIKSANGNK